MGSSDDQSYLGPKDKITSNVYSCIYKEFAHFDWLDANLTIYGSFEVAVEIINYEFYINISVLYLMIIEGGIIIIIISISSWLILFLILLKLATYNYDFD
jgi:hypothetical protein